MEIPHDASIFVTDGRKALLLRNEGDDRYANLQLVQKWEHRLKADRDLKSDGPGRTCSSSSGGTRRSSYRESNFHDAAETDFVSELAGILYGQIQRGEIKQLVVVAPPRALGEFRKHLSDDMRHAVIAELDKDLVNQPVSKIEQSILRYIQPKAAAPA